MKRFLDRVSMTVSSAPGTGPYPLGAAVTGYQSFATAGMQNGDMISAYVVDGANWQCGEATYSTSGPTLTFTTITDSSNGGAAINASSGAIVTACVLGGDLAGLLMARAAVSDANASVAANVGVVAYTAITAARTVTLLAAASFNPGQRLLVVDESGACSATNTITLSRAGADTIDGATSVAIASAYGYVELESNGSNAWAIVGRGAAAASVYPTTQNVVTGSRAKSTIYQNTTGVPMYVAITTSASAAQTASVYCDSSSTPTTVVAQVGGASGEITVATFIVLPGYYYEVGAGGSISIIAWVEWH